MGFPRLKPPLLDIVQERAPLNQVSVIMIYANRVEDAFWDELPDMLCKESGDALELSFLPCVVDLERRICTFDSRKIPDDFQITVKNRGLRLIRKYLFHDRLSASDSPDLLPPVDGDLDLNQSLWHFWRYLKKEHVLNEQRRTKRFRSMQDRELFVKDGCLYLKWKARGIWPSVEMDDKRRIAWIEAIDFWAYPKHSRIAKDTARQIRSLIDAHFAALGCTTRYGTGEWRKAVFAQNEQEAASNEKRKASGSQRNTPDPRL